MYKKSNKTSHVLNLITNRTGISPEELEQNTISSQEERPAETLVRVQTERIVEVPVERIIEVPVERIVEVPVERIVEAPAKKRVNVANLSGDVAAAVSEQIRASLEIIENEQSKAREQVRMEENAGMSIEMLTKEVTPAVAAVKRDQPQVRTFDFENFDESTESIAEPEEIIEQPEEIAAEISPPEKAPVIPPEKTPAAAEPIKEPIKEPVKEHTFTIDQKSMEGLVLINILEEVMRLEAPKVMKGLEMCGCDRCINDVLAIALNSIPPKYVVTQRGALFAKISAYGTQYQTDIFAHLTKACVTVGKAPSHS